MQVSYRPAAPLGLISPAPLRRSARERTHGLGTCLPSAMQRTSHHHRSQTVLRLVLIYVERRIHPEYGIGRDQHMVRHNVMRQSLARQHTNRQGQDFKAVAIHEVRN